jgi:hypothetical protein
VATEKGRVETFGAVLKDVVSALRDSILLILFLLLLFAPTTIKDRLISAGFTKGSIGGFEWEAQIKSAAEQTKAVGQTVGEATENYSNLIERLSELEEKITDPVAKAAVKNIGKVAETSRAELTTADRALKRSLATQQQVVAKIDTSAIADSGWMFLGRVNEDKTAWSVGSPQTVSPTTVPLSQGAKLTVLDDAYLRADGPSNARSSAAILGVAKVGETLQVVEVDHSHAKRGGWFVWAKVRRT